MNTVFKKTVCSIVVIAVLCTVAYGAYALYHIVMSDVEIRIQHAVAEGIKEGLLTAVNPLSWPRALIEQYTQ